MSESMGVKSIVLSVNGEIKGDDETVKKPVRVDFIGLGFGYIFSTQTLLLTGFVGD